MTRRLFTLAKWIPASVALTIRTGAANQGTAILEFVDIQKAERIRYDVPWYSRDWKEDAQMLKAYMKTVFPKNINPAHSNLTSASCTSSTQSPYTVTTTILDRSYRSSCLPEGQRFLQHCLRF